MRIHATINERLLRRSFREHTIGRYGLTVIDRDFPAFGLKVAKNGTRTFFVRAVRHLGAKDHVLGTTEALTAAQAREQAVAAAKAERATGPLFAAFVEDFERRQARRCKPSTRASNRHLVERYLVPFFGAIPVAAITRADVRSWFDSLSGTPGTANRTLPVLSVMMR